MKNMRAIALGGLCALAATMGVVTLSDGAGPKESAAEVIMMRCSTDGSSFPVKAYHGSTNAPAKRSDSCPETLSLLMRAGFHVLNVSYSDHDADFVVYSGGPFEMTSQIMMVVVNGRVVVDNRKKEVR